MRTLVLPVLFLAACSDTGTLTTPRDARAEEQEAGAAIDTGAAEDASARDAGATDTGTHAADVGVAGADATVDAGVSAQDARVSAEDARVSLDARTPDSGPAGDAGPVENCNAYPFSHAVLMSELAGFAEGTTGGNPNNVYRVTSRNNSGPGTLRDALESTTSRWVVFDVEGEFRLATRIRIGSNKTVDGRGRDVRIVGDEGVFDYRVGTENVILTDLDLSMHEPEDDSGDVIGIRGNGGPLPSDFDTKRLWFHHLGLHYGGDGLLDIRGGTQITISWSHMYNHTKVFLHQADNNDNLVAGMHVTYHHNFFDTLTRRSPHFAAGKADFYNNYQYHWYEYAAASIDEAQFLSENNIYEARPGRFCIPSCPDPSPHGGGNDFTVSKVALSTDWAVRNTQGFSRSVGDLLENDAEISENQPNRVFMRSTYYQATPEVADQALKQRIRDGAGPRNTYCQ